MGRTHVATPSTLRIVEPLRFCFGAWLTSIQGGSAGLSLSPKVLRGGFIHKAQVDKSSEGLHKLWDPYMFLPSE